MEKVKAFFGGYGGGLLYTLMVAAPLGWLMGLRGWMLFMVAGSIVWIASHTLTSSAQSNATRLIRLTLGAPFLIYAVSQYSVILEFVEKETAMVLTVFLLATGFSSLVQWVSRVREEAPTTLGTARLTGSVLPKGTDRDRRVVAIHESGHALLHALALPCLDERFSLTLNDDGTGLTEGSVYSYLERHKHLSAPFVQFHLMVLLAGRAAEDVMLGNHTAGSQDDLNRWMASASHYGNSCLGLCLYQPAKNTQEAEANLSVLKRFQEQQYVKVWKLLSVNQSILEEVAEDALKKGQLGLVELRPYLERMRIPDGYPLLTADMLS